MAVEEDMKETLLQRVAAKRSEVRAFISKTQPRKTRLVNIAIVCSAIAAAFTAGPAFGGDTLTAWLTQTLGLTSPAWQLLCLAATGSSVAAAIATNLSKSHDLASRLLRAQTTDAKLEGLETLIQMNQVSVDKASSLYVEYLNEIPFL